MITLILIRHGETTWNNAGKIQGSSDTSILNKKGKKQAQNTAVRLSQLAIDVIYSSQLKRAKQTARIISKTVNTKIVVSQKLNERSFGVMEGMTTDYVFGKLNAMSDSKRHLYRPKGGESTKDVEERVSAEIRKIISRHEGKTVLIVAHGGVIKILINYLKKIPWEKRMDERIKNSSVTLFKIHEEEILEEIINDTKHLDED